MKILIFCLVVLLLLLQYKLWNPYSGLIHTLRLHQEAANQRIINDELAQKNEKLTDQIYRLKNNKNSVELLAREKLGMIKQDEYYYRIIEQGN